MILMMKAVILPISFKNQSKKDKKAPFQTQMIKMIITIEIRLFHVI